MIDYATRNRPNQLLGGLTADALLWQGREIEVELSIDERGVITDLRVCYLMPQDEFVIHVRLIVTNNGTILYQAVASHEGKDISTRYLPDDAKEATFCRWFGLMKAFCQRKATAELINEIAAEA